MKKIINLLVIALLINGCASSKKSKKEFLDVLNNTNKNDISLNEDKKINKKKLILITPGFFRAYSLSGIFKVIESENFQYDAIYATSLEALVVSMILSKGINSTEWILFKNKNDDFIEKNFIGIKKNKLNSGLFFKLVDDNLSNLNLDNLKKKFYVGVTTSSENKINFNLYESGKLTQIIKEALLVPGFIEQDKNYDGTKFSGFFSNIIPIEIFKEKYNYEVICLNLTTVIDDKNLFNHQFSQMYGLMKLISYFVQEKIKKCDRVITFNEKNIDYFDFDHQADVLEYGEELGKELVKE
jgi:hypothetical protein